MFSHVTNEKRTIIQNHETTVLDFWFWKCLKLSVNNFFFGFGKSACGKRVTVKINKIRTVVG